MRRCDDLLRRRFIAVATDRFDADGAYPALDVASEVTAMRTWLCDADLGERQFEPGFERLAARPSKTDIEAVLADHGGFNDSDAVVVYVTGHGATDFGRHRIVLEHSDPQRLATTSLATTDLVVWLAQQHGLDQVLLIIDLCQAGDVHAEIVRDIEQHLPKSWIVLLSTSPRADAKVGALTGVIASVLAEGRSGAQPLATEVEPFLQAPVFIGRVYNELLERHRQTLTVVKHPWGASCCLPNPGFAARGGDRVSTTAARSDLAVLEQDMVAHWRLRAPVAAAVPEERPWVFTGRALFMKRLIAAATGARTSLVVMGRAGSGKSAVLARLVTCSDPVFRSEHGALLARVQPVPPVDAVDVAVLATGKGPEQIAAQVGRALGVEFQPFLGETALDSWVSGIRDALFVRGADVTVVLDALDESSDPVGVVRSFLQRLNPPDERLVRLIVGVRSVPDRARSSERAGGLAGLVVEALDADAIAADADEFWEPEDLRSFVAQALADPPSPYAGQPAEAARVAAAVEAGVERSYLLARLVTAELLTRDVTVPADGPELGELLAGGVAEVVRKELSGAVDDLRERERVLVLLRAAALGFGRGIPQRDVWPAAASAIAPRQAAIGDADVAWLLGHRLSGYLVRDLEDDVTVYRPFHDALRESLARHVDRYADGMDAHPGHAEAHGRIGRALLARFEPQRRELPPPYARRHLLEHAAAADELGADFLTVDTLPLLEAFALSRSLRLIRVDPYSTVGFLLGAWRGVRHRWSWDHPEANTAALDMALTAAGAPPPRRPPTSAPSWAPRWAEWAFGGTVVGVEERDLRAIALGTLADRACLVTAGGWDTQIWDAATSELLGPAIRTESLRRIALVPMPDEELLVAAVPSGLQAWDAGTGAGRWTFELTEPRLVTAGGLDGRRVVAAASAGSIALLDARTGRPLVPEFGDGAGVRGLVVVTDPFGRTRVVAGRGDGTVEQWYVDALPAEIEVVPAPRALQLGAEVNAVAGICHNGRFLVATATATGIARLWDGDSGEPAGPECVQTDEVRSVALAETSGVLLMATGGFDQQAIVWNPYAGAPSTEPMPHPDTVFEVTFGIVDGRLMLATACSDHNARLWDPVKPSAARVATTGQVQRVALARTAGASLLAGTAHDGNVRVWDADSGQLVQRVVLAPPSGPLMKMAGPTPKDVAVGELGGRAVVAATTDEHARLWDVGDGKLLGELRLDGGRMLSVTVAVIGSSALVAFVREDRRVEVRDLLHGRRLFTTPITHGYEWSIRVAFLRHEELGTVLAVTDENGIALVDVEHGRALWPLVTAPSSGACALGRVDGDDVVAFFRPEGIGLWNLTGAAALGPGVAHRGGQTGLAFAEVGGQRLLLSAHSMTVRAWHPQTGRLVTELRFGTTISSLAVLPAAAGADNVLVAVSGPGVAVAELTAGS